MKIEKANLVYFSPTGTTKKIITEISKGLELEKVGGIDLTLPGAENIEWLFSSYELVLIGSPVYSGRIPEIAVRRFRNLRGDNTPVTLAVLYGNRAYEDALLELKDLSVDLGFKPIAAASFIGEHSYSNKETPIAHARPDEKDLEKAELFGQMVMENLDNETISEVGVPGNRPYRKRSILEPKSPETNHETCIKCGICANVCPSGAITVENTVNTAFEDCILCSACVKNCPVNARTWIDHRVLAVSKWLHTNCIERKEPELFI